MEFAHRTERPITHKGERISPAATKALKMMNLHDRMWRMNNLYHIVNKDGDLVKFRMRPLQRHFIENIWYRNCLLKSRQLGFTTVIDLWQLDMALFIDHTKAVIIAHRQDDATEILEAKVAVPYANLHPALHELIQISTSNKSEMTFSNGSGVRVTSSGRSGTAQCLHVSELGYTSRHRPEIASEIITGSFPMIHPGKYIHVESTAEGSSGEFYDLCMSSLNKKREGRKLSRLEFKFHFYGWHQDDSNALPPEEAELINIPDRLHAYFVKLLDEHGIALNTGQKAWYTTQEDLFQDRVKREHPSTPEEAFENSGEGIYFSRQMARVREEDRLIDELPHQSGRLVVPYFDIGVNDPTACWFIQQVGPWFHVLGYYENADNGMDYHITQVRSIAKENRWGLADVWIGPHDMKQRNKGSAIRLIDEVAKMGQRFDVVPRVSEKITSIEVARRILGSCRFARNGPNMSGDTGGISRLDNYKKKWNRTLGIWDDKPLHDANSDGADAFQCFAMHVEGADIDFQNRSRAQPDPRNNARTDPLGLEHKGDAPERRRRMRAFTI